MSTERKKKMYSRGFMDSAEYVTLKYRPLLEKLGIEKMVILQLEEKILSYSRDKVPPKERCGHIIPWCGPCNSTKLMDNGMCDKHQDMCDCGKPATRGCSHASSFVCGNPLCDDCKCNH